MYYGFFSSALAKKGVESVVPKQEDGEEINRIIYEELINNIFRNESFNNDSGMYRHLQTAIRGCRDTGPHGTASIGNGHVNFPARMRYSAMITGFNLSFCIFDGTAPLVATWLVIHYGSIFAPAIYLTLLAVASFLATLSYTEAPTTDV
jgi:hypothetical protein